MYKPSYKKPSKPDFDLIVLGTGSGGGVASHIAATAGKKVAVVEMEKIGGECPNYGCVPTKALLHAAEVYQTVKDGHKFGLRASSVNFQYPAVKAWKDKAVFRTGTSEGEAVYRHEGIHVIHGHAHFINPWTISVGEQRYTARKFLIATGTTSLIPPIPGLQETGFITYREAINLLRPPHSLFVLGGGAIGTEFTHLFSTFGTKVTIADVTPRLVAAEDAEVGELIGALFESRGIQVLTNAKVTKVGKKGLGKVVEYERNGQTHHVVVEEVLLASGKAPNTDIGLDNAGVIHDKRGIKTDRFMQTSTKHIFAAGDVVGPYRFTHTASYQSRIAAHNMLHPSQKVAATYHAVPRCVFTNPEVACVGATEQQLEDRKVQYQVSMVPVSILGRANTSNQDDGFVKVIASSEGTLLGASIVSQRAGEAIQELSLAIQHRMKASDIAETIHPYPTWTEAIRIACQKLKSL